jgi:hypothetical protein
MSDHAVLLDRIRALALALRADLGTIDQPFSVDLVELGEMMGPLTAAIESFGRPVPDWLPSAIAIGHPDGGRTLVFSADGDFDHQVEHNIEQVQDEVAEITTDQWPPCPEHNHALLPSADARSVVWTCPSSGEVVAAVGGLSGLS